MEIQYRSGHPKDSAQIAAWINTIGHGHIEYLLQNLLQGVTALQHLALVLDKDPNYSCKNVDMAVMEDGIIGLVFSYISDSNKLTTEVESVLSDERVQWMRYFSDNQVENSWYINTLGVAEEYRRQGIGRSLLELAAKRALQNGIQCLSLHVYENNEEAIKLYQSYGFVEEKKIDLTGHPFFVSRNLVANILMKCDVSSL